MHVGGEQGVLGEEEGAHLGVHRGEGGGEGRMKKGEARMEQAQRAWQWRTQDVCRVLRGVGWGGGCARATGRVWAEGCAIK